MNQSSDGNGSQRNYNSDAPKFHAQCTKCLKDAVVKFPPTPGRAVYCDDCWREVRANRPPRNDFGAGRREF